MRIGIAGMKMGIKIMGIRIGIKIRIMVIKLDVE